MLPFSHELPSVALRRSGRRGLALPPERPEPQAEQVYLTMVSLSTVGYGDLSPKTKAARLFCAAFLLVGPGQGEGQGQGAWAPSLLPAGGASAPHP